MEMKNEIVPYAVYVRADERGRILEINSDAFLHPTDLWTCIDSGFDDKCHYAECNYFPMPIVDERGIYRYKLEDGKPVERTADEMDADDVPHETQFTDAERIAALEEQNAFLTECLLEMSEIIYA